MELILALASTVSVALAGQCEVYSYYYGSDKYGYNDVYGDKCRARCSEDDYCPYGESYGTPMHEAIRYD